MAIDPSRVQLVQQSFGRCVLNQAHGQSFLDAFYDAFLAADPRIKPLFAKTDMGKQKDLLRQGLVMLIMYGNGTGLARSAVQQLAVKHDHAHLNIRPEMYGIWLRSLLATARRFDPKWDPALEAAWNEVLGLGLQAMKQAY